MSKSEIIHINATPEFLADREKMAFVELMCILAGNKIRKPKNQKKKRINP